MNLIFNDPDYPVLLAIIARETGWENEAPAEDGSLCFTSAFHEAVVCLRPSPGQNRLAVEFSSAELSSKVTDTLRDGFFVAPGIISADLKRVAEVLRHASAEARVLAALDSYNLWNKEVDRELHQIKEPLSTERKAEVVQRIGQDLYRKALMILWDGRCAVTGIDIPEILRASHARPWADCTTDRQRVDPYNGFLLSANLDLLFDSGLISFDEEGRGLVSSRLSPE